MSATSQTGHLADAPQPSTAASWRAAKRPKVRRNPWFVVLGTMLVVICLDPFHVVTAAALKQAPLAIAAVVIAAGLVANRFRIDLNLPVPALAVILLLLIAVPGLAINKLDGAQSSLFTAVMLLVIPLSVFALPRSWIDAQDARASLGWCGAIASAFLIGAVLQLELHRRGLTYIRIHERAFLAPLAILVPLLLRRRGLFLIGLASVLYLLFRDPRTTLLLVLVITAGMWLYVFRLKSNARRFLLAAALAVSVVGALEGPAILRAIDDQYKGSLGQKSNSDFRSNLIEVGVREFARSPFVGDWFRGPTSFDSGAYELDVDGHYQVIMAPLHNDYLEFATKGGIVGAGLMVAGIGGTVVLGLSNRRRFLAAGLRGEADVQGMLAIVVTGLMFTMLVNPVLNNPACAAPAYFMIAQIWLGYRQVRRLSTERLI